MCIPLLQAESLPPCPTISRPLVTSGIYDEAVVEESSYNGEVIAVPHMLSNAGWFYNKQYFEDAGLVDENGDPILPTNMEEVLQTAAKLAKYDQDGNLVNSGLSLRLTARPAARAKSGGYC